MKLYLNELKPFKICDYLPSTRMQSIICSIATRLRAARPTTTVTSSCESTGPRGLIASQTEEKSLLVPYTQLILGEVAGTTSKGSSPPHLVSTATTASIRNAPTVTLKQALSTKGTQWFQLRSTSQGTSDTRVYALSGRGTHVDLRCKPNPYLVSNFNQSFALINLQRYLYVLNLF